MKFRDYRGLLWVFAAGILGISLLCSVSGMAIQDLNIATAVALQPGDVVESFVENLNTAGAITLEAFSELAATSTPTLAPSATFTSSPTVTVSSTPVIFRFPTLSGPTRTRRPRPIVTPTRTRVPPTRTPIPPTNTLPPTPTDTPEPPTPTDTPVPPPTTEVPSPTTAPSATSGPPISGESPTPGP